MTVRVASTMIVVLLVLTACGQGQPAAPATEAAGDSSPTPAPTAAPEPEPVAVDGATVTVREMSFQPEELVGTAGETVSLTVENVGEVEHTFTIEALGVDEEVDNGAPPVDISFETGDPGVYDIVCRFHSMMSATLTVE